MGGTGGVSRGDAEGTEKGRLGDLGRGDVNVELWPVFWACFFCIRICDMIYIKRRLKCDFISELCIGTKVSK